MYKRIWLQTIFEYIIISACNNITRGSAIGFSSMISAALIFLLGFSGSVITLAMELLFKALRKNVPADGMDDLSSLEPGCGSSSSSSNLSIQSKKMIAQKNLDSTSSS